MTERFFDNRSIREKIIDMSSMKPTEWAMLVLLSTFWGGSFFFVEIALRGFQPFALVFLRVTIAAFILLVVVYIRGQRMPNFSPIPLPSGSSFYQ